jgi:DNA-directed RNA polymerase subunit omega
VEHVDRSVAAQSAESQFLKRLASLRRSFVDDATQSPKARGVAASSLVATNPFDKQPLHLESRHSFFTMFAPQLTPSALAGSVPTILQFPTEASRPVRSLRHMTTQLLQEAAQVIPNQQLLINVVSKRVRQLGLGHRPMVETTPRMSLTDIALKEIIAGKLTFEALESPGGA